MSKIASEYLLEALEKTGVKRVYGVVRDSLSGFTDALRRGKSIDRIHMRHEEAAAFAAGPKLILPEASRCAPAAAVRAILSADDEEVRERGRFARVGA